VATLRGFQMVRASDYLGDLSLVASLDVTAIERAVEAFRGDPEMKPWDTDADIGGCWNTAHRFAWYLHEAGVSYRFLRWRNQPTQRNPYQHNVEVDGLVICWTHRQYEPDLYWPGRGLERAKWPHVQPVADYVALGFVAQHDQICPACGGKPHAASDCGGIVRDPWEPAVAKFITTLSRAERRALERQLANGTLRRRLRRRGLLP
jgi:hypothetical protein